ncbi:unnamed protein product [Moneuplotes crassus]|uniref:Ankyrin repeat protein n=1 Tax=Euplotes crassus TaxID=5936 RepID=A0AAD1XGY6_EUPCR|nr:unnamed protein product [Moneuplotes crassus]
MEQILEQENENVRLDTEQKKDMIKKYISTVPCPKCGHSIETQQTTSTNNIEIFEEKDREIEELKNQLEEQKQEAEVMVESFRISTDLLLERLKDLESVNFGGDRPQTAQVLRNIDMEKMNRPKIMDDIEPPQILNLEDEPKEELGEENKCTNCGDLIPSHIFAKHTIECIRNTVKCKICYQTMNKDKKKQHLLDWRNPKKMIKLIEQDDDETLGIMFNHGAKAEAHLIRSKKLKPLHLVAQHGSVRCLLQLMGNGLEELSPEDSSGDTPLNMAIRNNRTIIAKSLIELGADLEAKDASMRTPLMNACLYGNLEVVQKLLEVGADMGATNSIKDTCVTLAQRSKSQEIVMLLVDKGASLRPASSLGKLKGNGIASLKIKKKPS